MSETVNASPANGLFQEVRAALNTALDALESEQAKINKAFFETLSASQRDVFCQNLAAQNVKSKRIEKITGKSQPTVNRHLNSKNS